MRCIGRRNLLVGVTGGDEFGDLMLALAERGTPAAILGTPRVRGDAQAGAPELARRSVVVGDRTGASGIGGGALQVVNRGCSLKLLATGQQRTAGQDPRAERLLCESMAFGLGDRGASQQFTGIAATLLTHPGAVRGTDGRFHVAYEMVLTGTTPFAIDVQRVDVRDARTHRVLLSLARRALASRMNPVGGTPAGVSEPSRHGSDLPAPL